MKKWEHFRHGADIGVRGFGATPAEAFENAAMAMVAVIAPLKSISPERRIEIVLETPDVELLLYDWLNSLIYEMSVANMLFSRFEVAIEGAKLKAAALGEEIDPQRHKPAVEVKGATMSALKVARHRKNWIAQCIVDV